MVYDAPKEDENQGEGGVPSPPPTPPRHSRLNDFLTQYGLIVGFVVWIPACICGRAARFLLGAAMVAATSYIPDYVVVTLVFVSGMIGWRLLIKAPTRETAVLWAWFTGTWAAASCLAYSYASQGWHYQEVNGWMCLGGGSWLIGMGVAIVMRMSEKKDKGKS